MHDFSTTTYYYIDRKLFIRKKKCPIIKLIVSVICTINIRLETIKRKM